jgi:signal transduction histidine kinase
VEGWLGRLYRNRPRQYLLLCLLILAAGMGLVMVPIATAVTGRYEGLSVAQFGVTLAAAVPLVGVAVTLGALMCRRRLGLVHTWITRPRDGQPIAEIASAANALPLQLLVTIAVASCATSEPVGITMTLQQLNRFRFADFALLTIGGLFFAVWGLVAAWTWLELCFRPVLAELSDADPEVDGVIRQQRVGVAARLTIAIGASFLVGACYAGAISADAGQQFDGLGKLLLISVGVSAAFGAVLVPLYSSVLLGPIRKLIDATRQVERGSLDLHVPVTGHDELAELTSSFNSMVTGLRERADLREANLRLISELRASRERIVVAADTARRQVERDLHDGAQQRLVTARLRLGLLRRHLEVDEGTDEMLASLDDDLEQGLYELRELAHGVYPAQLDDDGLRGALQYAARHAAIPTTFVCANGTRYRPEVETAVYFSCLEALQNATKHATGEAEARIELSDDDTTLRFSVSDTGPGFDPQSVRPSSGLQNIVDRVGAVGGQVSIESAVGAGTRISGEVPLRHPSAAL